MNKIITLNQIRDWPIWSKKSGVGAAGPMNTQFFNESGGSNAFGNIDSPGQFSNTQFYIAHGIGLKYFGGALNSSDMTIVAEFTRAGFLQLVKNKDLVWESSLTTILTNPTQAATNGWAAVEGALGGYYKFNESILFRPGEKFTMLLGGTTTSDLSSIGLELSFRGYLGIQEELST